MDMSIYKAILDSLVCLSAIATGVSAVVAVVHYLRHWRDDDVKLSVVLIEDETDMVDGKACWSATLRIANVGKVPVTVTALEIAEEDVAEKFVLDLDSADINKLLNQGASFKHDASVTAEERGIPLPNRFTLRAKWTMPEATDGKIVVEPA